MCAGDSVEINTLSQKKQTHLPLVTISFLLHLVYIQDLLRIVVLVTNSDNRI